MQLFPDTQWIHFIDADCEMVHGWLARGVEAAKSDATVAAVGGQLRERHPERSLYNRLCEMEWKRKPGVAKSFCGIVLIRSDVLQQSGGYSETMIAGEDPELAYRIRQNGWKILQLADDMAWHDANILHFRQWWRRMVRGGHAYAESAAMHGQEPERYCVRQTVGAVLFGAIVPAILILIVGLAFWRVRLLWLEIIPLLAWGRIVFASYRRRRSMGDRRGMSFVYGLIMVPAKIAEAVGVAKFILNRARGRRSGLIEYKQIGTAM
jgi:GT2 family glycosyltransferase